MPTWRASDPVYDGVELPRLLEPVINHRIVKKLQHVKQLGYAYHVFPSATHTRFAHSLGVAHLARQVLMNLESGRNSVRAGGGGGGAWSMRSMRVALECAGEGGVADHSDSPAPNHEAESTEDDSAPLSSPSSGSEEHGESHKDPNGPVAHFLRQLSDTDRICILVAALVHDIGHPAFSHGFEHWMHGNDEPGFSHEIASRKLLPVLWADVAEPMRKEYNKEIKAAFSSFTAKKILLPPFTAKDLEFIQELIELPGKKQLRQHLLAGTLRENWGHFVKGRPISHAWAYEVVSNWRGGMDVDRMDYFLRDSASLGVRCPVEWARWAQSLKLVAMQERPPREQVPRLAGFRGDGSGKLDPDEVAPGVSVSHSLTTSYDSDIYIPSIAMPTKDRETIATTFFQWRQEIYPRTYRHPTVARVEACLLRAMTLLTSGSEASGPNASSGSKTSAGSTDLRWIFEAADLSDEKFDWRKYIELTDGSVERAIAEHGRASCYYDYAVTERKMLTEIGAHTFESMDDCRSGRTQGEELKRLRDYVLKRVVERDWNAMTAGANEKNPFKMPAKDREPDALDFDVGATSTSTEALQNFIPVYDEFHQGNKDRDPLECAVFYDSKGKKEPTLGAGTGLSHVRSPPIRAKGMNAPLSPYMSRQIRFLFDMPKTCAGCGKRFLMQRPEGATPVAHCTCTRPPALRAELSRKGQEVVRKRLAATVQEWILEHSTWACAPEAEKAYVLEARGTTGLSQAEYKLSQQLPVPDGANDKRQLEGE
eukprot:g11059.t1